MEHMKSSPTREIHSSNCLHYSIRKSTKKCLYDATQEFGKRRTNPIKYSRPEEKAKIIWKSQEIQKKIIQRINKSKSWFFEKINKILAHLTKIKKEGIQ